MKRDVNIFSLLLIVSLVFSSVGWAETIFDSFDSDPTTRGWTKSETETSFDWLDDLVVDATGNEYVAGGYISASMHRAPDSDRLNVALSQTHDQSQEFWMLAIITRLRRKAVGIRQSATPFFTNQMPPAR